MKRLSILAMVALVVAEVLVLSVVVVTPARALQTDQPSCVVTLTQDFNRVTFEVAWAGGSPEGTYPFQFGDQSLPDVLTGASGSKSLPHDYAWNVGGVATYTAGVVIGNGEMECRCSVDVVIDDQVVVPSSYVVHLPLVLGSTPPPTVEISRQSSEAFNHVVVQVTWSGADEVWHRFDWGDNAYIDMLGSQGDRTIDHWYAAGSYTATFAVTGPGGTTTRQLLVTIKP